MKRLTEVQNRIAEIIRDVEEDSADVESGYYSEQTASLIADYFEGVDSKFDRLQFNRICGPHVDQTWRRR